VKIAEVLLERGTLPQALKEVRIALKADPYLYEGYCLLAEILRAMGADEAAQEAMRKAQLLKPGRSNKEFLSAHPPI